jgi:haloacetate dehalogenase
MGAEDHADYQRAIHDPATVRAMRDDYRAGLGVDRDADEANRAAGRRTTCPTLVLWSAATTWQTCTATSSPSGDPGPPS